MIRFRNPTKIMYGAGSINRMKDVVEEEFRATRIFLVTDKGIQKSGIADKVLSQLSGVQVFDLIEQNPKHTTVDIGGRIARKMKPELIIGLGGGSCLDGAKAIALLATNPGLIEDYEGLAMYQTAPLPLLAVPTTCGTGSEVTWVAVVSHTKRMFKMSIKGPEMYPAAALIDPDLLATLPPALVASTGLDALTHAIEAYTVKPATFITDTFALEAVRHIFQSIEEAPTNIRDSAESRDRIMKGSVLAGLAFGNSDVGAVHCLSEAVGSLYDTPHGVANAVFLPYVMEFNFPVSFPRYALIARAAGIPDTNDEKAARTLIDKIKQLNRTLEIPFFKDLGILEIQFPEIAKKSFKNNSNPSNPREANIDDYLKILDKAYNGE